VTVIKCFYIDFGADFEVSSPDNGHFITALVISTIYRR